MYLNGGRLLQALKLFLFPGRSLAMKMDKSFAEFLEELEKEVESGNKRLLLHERIISAEYVVMLVGGLLSGYYGYAPRAVPLLVLLLPVLAVADIYASKRVFKKLSWRPKYITSLLWCSDMVYHFALGSIVGSVIASLGLLAR